VLLAWCRASVRAKRGQMRVGCTGTPLHALRGLGGMVTYCGHGRGEVHGGLEVMASSGIDRACTEEFYGEVTGPEVVGGVLAMLGCPRWAWQWPGRRGVSTPSRCDVGLGLGFLGVASLHWGV
jgi:hypothetical protein